MENAEVLDAKRINGEAVKVRIVVGPFEIDFVKSGKKAIKTFVARYDKQITDPSDLYVPPYFYEPAKKEAYGIFFPGKKRNLKRSDKFFREEEIE